MYAVYDRLQQRPCDVITTAVRWHHSILLNSSGGAAAAAAAAAVDLVVEHAVE